ncbi:hypothetical protein I5M27_09555 [Adhaeribacter sp. BT258]|uniref:Uncharacterized protein n=1 Tax=Adhaeribacter terrigena TaxID=2793070 RepID=A0ABS1C1F2_9BACT|nr:hypothetical protein [Adhaeribacter terrigena]MBK0403231.1 hypothetical protein [Adhaeribacter terrigena]
MPEKDTVFKILNLNELQKASFSKMFASEQYGFITCPRPNGTGSLLSEVWIRV